MAAARPIMVGDRYFGTKGEAQQAVRDVWNAYEVGDRINDPDHEAFLLDLVSMHSNPASKVGTGIDYFRVVHPRDTGAWVRNSRRGVEIVRVDGAAEEFSPLKVLDVPRTAFQKLSEALDNEARDITGRVREEAFEGGGPVHCGITGWLITTRSDAETRRVDPSLKELTQLFLAEIDRRAEEVELENLQAPTAAASGRRIRGRRLADPALRDAWLLFQMRHVDRLVVAHRKAPR